jgi:RimJ/RimL family protein N-acetyltransferase
VGRKEGTVPVAASTFQIPVAAELVEHNFELREFRATPLTHYSDQFSDRMIMTETIFETERLRCRQFNFDDLEDFFELGSDPNVIRFAEPRPLRDIAEARQRMIDAPMRDYEVYGYGRLAVEVKSSGEVIGFCGIKRLEELELDELGYRFKKHHWGMGYATEAGSATLLYAWRELGLDRVIALILDGNDASVNVATKLGMQQRGYVNFDGERPMLFDIHRPDGCQRTPPRD